MLSRYSGRMGNSVLLLALAVLLGFASARVRAEPQGAGAEPAGYKSAIAAGLSEFEHDNYLEAREHFTRAHALFPNARTLRGLGMVEFELHHYVESVGYLERALASDVKRLDAALREQTESLLARSRQYVGDVRLKITPANASVSVDGFPVSPGVDGSLRLEIGDHVFAFRAENRLEQRRAVVVRGEQVSMLEVVLPEPATKVQVAATPLDARPGSERRPVYKKWWFWTLTVAAVAGGVTAAVLLTRKTEYNEQPISTANTPPDGALQPLLRY